MGKLGGLQQNKGWKWETGSEVEVRVGNLKIRKASGKDEVTGEMVNGGCNMVLDWIWSMCNMAFKSGVWP